MTSPVVEAGDALPLTIPALLRSRADEQPDRVLLAVDDASLTYGEAHRRSSELARSLLATGIGPGSRVALLFPNTPDFVVAWVGAGPHRRGAHPLEHVLHQSRMVPLCVEPT